MNNRPEEPKIRPFACDPADTSGYTTDIQSITNTAHSNLYRLVLNVPCKLKPYLSVKQPSCAKGNFEKLEYSVWGTVVPDIETESMEVPFAGQVLKFSSLARPAYAPITCNYTVSNDYSNYYVLWKWLDLVNTSREGTREAAYVPEYATTIQILLMDEYKNVVAEVTYYDAFITGLGKIDYTSRQGKEIESSFTFQFSQMHFEIL